MVYRARAQRERQARRLTGKALPWIVAIVADTASGMDAPLRDHVLVNEARTELKGSIAAWLGLTVVTAVLAFEFVDRADPNGFAAWFATLSLLLIAWLAAWVRFMVRPPTDRAILAG